MLDDAPDHSANLRYYEEKDLPKQATGKVMVETARRKLFRTILLAISMFIVAAILTNSLILSR